MASLPLKGGRGGVFFWGAGIFLFTCLTRTPVLLSKQGLSYFLFAEAERCMGNTALPIEYKAIYNV